MKDFIEKLKDILYNGMDYIIMIGIVAGIALIINWRIGGLFDITSVEDVYGETPEESTEIVENDKNGSVKEEDTEENSIENENESETSNEKEREIVNIEIPTGSLPGDIANILVSNGLVESKEEFLDNVIGTKYETKLRAGEFEIPSDASIEEILDIITR